jgi:predicted small lipoprotein YifL
LNRIKNLSTVFHLLIIAIFVLSVNGCGYKKAPYYQEEAPAGDENVEFIIKEPIK